MTEKPKEEKLLTDKQLELANHRKEQAVRSAVDFLKFIQNQDERYFLKKKPYFKEHAHAYNTVLYKQWKEEQNKANLTPEVQTLVENAMPQQNSPAPKISLQEQVNKSTPSPEMSKSTHQYKM